MKNTLQILLFISLMSTYSMAQADQKNLQVPFKYALGKNLFEKNCSSCHGVLGGGTDKGPTFMHAFYKPNHHGDASFYRAALQGVKTHHWNYGDMPRVEGITKRTLGKIVPYIRWVQRQNGIQ